MTDNGNSRVYEGGGLWEVTGGGCSGQLTRFLVGNTLQNDRQHHFVKVDRLRNVCDMDREPRPTARPITTVNIPE
jgi:hypothetical protein